MDFFGIGPLELALVLLVAIMVLGPARMVDMARSLGKFWGEAQRMLRETADAATARLDIPLTAGDRAGEHEQLGPPEGSVGSSEGLASFDHVPPAAPDPEQTPQEPRRHD